jgi:hypothetical protein
LKTQCQTLAVPGPWINPFSDGLGLIALDAKNLRVSRDFDFAAGEVDEDTDGGWVFSIWGRDAGGIVGGNGDEFWVSGLEMRLED